MHHREQILKLTKLALEQAHLSPSDIDVLAFTKGIRHCTRANVAACCVNPFVYCQLRENGTPVLNEELTAGLHGNKHHRPRNGAAATVSCCCRAYTITAVEEADNWGEPLRRPYRDGQAGHWGREPCRALCQRRQHSGGWCGCLCAGLLVISSLVISRSSRTLHLLYRTFSIYGAST